MNAPQTEHRAPLQWGEMDPFRKSRARAGMWAWLVQRVSAVCAVLFLVLHLIFTYKPYLQFLLLLCLSLHASLGIRVILLDCDLVSVSRQRWLIPWLAGAGLAALALTWIIIY